MAVSWRSAAAIALLCAILLCGCIGTREFSGSPVTLEPALAPVPVGTTIPPDVLPDTAVTTVPPTPPPTPCIPDWSCSNWSACNTTGLQARDCADGNACGALSGRPSLTQQCTYVRKLPSPGPYAVSVTGDTVCRQTAENAINTLRYRASPDYEYFRRYVGAVNCTFSNICYMTGFTAGEPRFYTVCIASLEEPPTVYIDEPFWRADPVWLAGVFVHEACHSEGYQEYILREGGQYDLTEFAGWKFERRCCDRMRSAWNQLGAAGYTYDLYRGCSL